MDRLQQVFTFIRQRLGALTPAHKMIVGSAAIIALMSLFVVSQYAGKASMVRLDVAEEDIARSARLLAANSIDYEDAAEGLMVPETMQRRAVSVVMENNVSMGESAHANLRNLMQNQKWWQNRQQNQQAWNLGMSEFLSAILREWSYLDDAVVVINSPLERTGIGQTARKPTASVAVRPHDSELTSDQVEAIARMVAGAVDGLSPTDVQIVDTENGRPLRVEDPGSYQTSDYLELRAQWESDYTNKIYNALRFIPGVIVAINAQVVAGHERVQDLRYRPEDEGSVTLLSQESLQTVEQVGEPDGAEAGVRPNTGTQISIGGGGPGEVNNTRDEVTTFDTHAGTTSIERFNPGGYARKINATINVPRSYFVSIWRTMNPAAANPPTDTDLGTVIQSEEENIRAMITPLIDTAAINSSFAGDQEIETNGEVSVNMYYDVETASTTQESKAGQGRAIGSFAIPEVFVGVTGRSVAVGALALLSLFMMLRLVRGAARKDELPTANELLGIPATLSAEEDELIGEADQAHPAMDALEMGEEEIRARNLTDQVEDMVKADPREAARLLDRWISTEG